MENKEHELITLKAQAYDCIKQIEAWQAKLRETNIKIEQLENEAKSVS